MTNILHLSNSCHACPNFSGCPIRKNSTTTSLIEKSKRIYDYKVDDIIINEGETSPIIGIVVDGALRTTITQSDGRQQVLGVHLQYSLFSHPFEKGSRYGVEAATNVRVCTFDRPSLERLILAQPELQHAILLATLDDLGAAKTLVSILGSLRAPERIARFFLHLAHRTDGKNQELRVPVGRRDLAALLGTTPETISRFVQEMVRNGVLHVKSARTLAILDRRKLDVIAGHAIQDTSPLARRPAPSPTGPGLSTKPVDIIKRLRTRQIPALLQTDILARTPVRSPAMRERFPTIVFLRNPRILTAINDTAQRSRFSPIHRPARQTRSLSPIAHFSNNCISGLSNWT